MKIYEISALKYALHGVFLFVVSWNLGTEKQQKIYENCTCRRDAMYVCFFRSSLRHNDFVPRSIGSRPGFSTVLDISRTDTQRSSAFENASSCCYVSLHLLFIVSCSSTAYGSARDFPGLV